VRNLCAGRDFSYFREYLAAQQSCPPEGKNASAIFEDPSRNTGKAQETVFAQGFHRFKPKKKIEEELKRIPSKAWRLTTYWGLSASDQKGLHKKRPRSIPSHAAEARRKTPLELEKQSRQTYTVAQEKARSPRKKSSETVPCALSPGNRRWKLTTWAWS